MQEALRLKGIIEIQGVKNENNIRETKKVAEALRGLMGIYKGNEKVAK